MFFFFRENFLSPSFKNILEKHRKMQKLKMRLTLL